MAVPAAPAAGEPIAEAWGDIVHDEIVAMEIQTGVVTITHASNPVANANVTFPHPFAEAPIVILTCDNYNFVAGHNGTQPTATGFVASSARTSGTAATNTVHIAWIAYGKRA
jgi:hypothetical protein